MTSSIVFITYDEFLILHRISETPFLLLLDAVWTRRASRLLLRLLAVNQRQLDGPEYHNINRCDDRNYCTINHSAQSSSSTTASPVFVLRTEGCDKIEDHFIWEFRVTSLPCVALCIPGQSLEAHLLYTSDIVSRDTLAHYYFNTSRKVPHSTMKETKLDHTSSASTSVSETYETSVFSVLHSSAEPSLLFVAGDRSSVGKSSLCLSLLAALLMEGLAPSELAYIKPVTQCEAEQPVTRFCRAAGIPEVSVGPVVFYQGFTRAFLAGETDSPAALLSSVVGAVGDLARGKRLVLVDGVGYPSVGSICSLSNADVASALAIPVLLVGRSGVGDAVDAHNLNASYFESRGLRVLGAVFNKLEPDPAHYYCRDACAAAVTSYFAQYKPTQLPYGFIPKVSSMSPDTLSHIAPSTDLPVRSLPLQPMKPMSPFVQAALREAGGDSAAVAEAVRTYLDLTALIRDLWLYQILRRTVSMEHEMSSEWIAKKIIAVSSSSGQSSTMEEVTNGHSSMAGKTQSSLPLSLRMNRTGQGVIESTEEKFVGRKRDRSEVESAARARGAKGG